MANNNSAYTIKTNIGEREFEMERLFNAPRELVFQAFTKPEHLARWWPPFGFTIPVCTIDLRPGGLWHYCMRSPEGQEHWVRSIYSEIAAPERMVYMTVFADKDANPVGGLPEQLTTATFAEQGSKTKLTLRIQFNSQTDLQAALEMNMAEGFARTWNNLDSHLQTMQEV